MKKVFLQNLDKVMNAIHGYVVSCYVVLEKFICWQSQNSKIAQ